MTTGPSAFKRFCYSVDRFGPHADFTFSHRPESQRELTEMEIPKVSADFLRFRDWSYIVKLEALSSAEIARWLLSHGTALSRSQRKALIEIGYSSDVSTQDLLKRRNTLIRLFRDIWYADVSQNAAAKAIALELSSYECGEWQHDKHRTRLGEAVSEKHKCKFEILSAGPVISFERLRKILSPGGSREIPLNDPANQ